MKDKKWKPVKPRFIVDVDERGMVSKDRVFKNGKVVYNQNLGMVYSVDEIVEVLNLTGESDDYLFDLLQAKIWYCQGMYNDTGDEKYKIEEECLKTLRDERYDRSSIIKYNDYLEKRFLERMSGGK